MAAHSSTLAWKIPWMEKPSRLYSLYRLYIVYSPWGCKESDQLRDFMCPQISPDSSQSFRLTD